MTKVSRAQHDVKATVISRWSPWLQYERGRTIQRKDEEYLRPVCERIFSTPSARAGQQLMVKKLSSIPLEPTSVYGFDKTFPHKDMTPMMKTQNFKLSNDPSNFLRREKKRKQERFFLLSPFLCSLSFFFLFVLNLFSLSAAAGPWNNNLLALWQAYIRWAHFWDRYFSLRWTALRRE